jgi:penicillin-binding protein 1C
MARSNLLRRLLTVAALLTLAGGAWGLLRGGWLAPDDPEAAFAARYGSTRVLDRHGRLLRELKGPLHTRSGRHAPVSPWLVRATLAAEDRRYFAHPGVDPLAVARAASQNLANLRVVSGASTLTQQTVKLLHPRPRTLLAKATEALRALHWDAVFGKERVLRLYFANAPYGPLVRGAETAARTYFAKPAAELTLSEAALLAVLPRAPSRLDPVRHPQEAREAQRRLLAKMQESGAASADEVDRALAQALPILAPGAARLAPHLADRAQSELALLAAAGVSAVHTTLDGDLQRDLQALVARHALRLRDRGVGNLALVALENATGELRALVGSADYGDAGHLGAVDGARARRQPGSALKPFAYATAFDLGLTPATLLPDLEARFATPDGDWLPGNYGRRFLGPVRARVALASSLNVPAVQLVERIGISAVRQRLAALGLHSLERDDSHYGLGLVLGDGEVTLLELAGAAATLARGGEFLPPRWLAAIDDTQGKRAGLARDPARRVFSPQAAWLTTHVLSDPGAREPAFGRGGALEMPFPAAAKTGTSKGFRDNWTVAWTPRWTVAAWGGNFDGRPLRDVTGVTGAAPLVHDALLRVTRGEGHPDFVRPDGLERHAICPLSGQLAHADCAGQTDEWFLAGTVPPPCSVHVARRVDARNGLLAGDTCPNEHVERKIFAQLPNEYQAWSARHLTPMPSAFSPLCPGPIAPRAAIRIAEPWDGATYHRDSRLPAHAQGIPLRAFGGRVAWSSDAGRIAVTSDGERAFWLPPPGRHRIVAQGLDSGSIETVTVELEGHAAAM